MRTKAFRLLSLLLAFLMLTSAFAMSTVTAATVDGASGAAAPKETSANPSIRNFYFTKPDNWSACFAYAFKEDGLDPAALRCGEWPGLTMSHVRDDIWGVSIGNVNFDRIIFNNGEIGGANQTVALDITGELNRGMLATTTTQVDSGADKDKWNATWSDYTVPSALKPMITMTPSQLFYKSLRVLAGTVGCEGDGAESYYVINKRLKTQITNGEKVYFNETIIIENFGQDDPVGTIYNFDVTAVNKYGTVTKTSVFKKLSSNAYAVINNAANWTNVWVFAWGAVGNAQWPGIEITAVGSATITAHPDYVTTEGWRKYTIPEDCIGGVIFNPGSSNGQSADLAIAKGETKVYNNSTKTWVQYGPTVALYNEFELQFATAKEKQRVPENFTATSFDALCDVIASASVIVNKSNPSDAELTTGAAALNTALNELVDIKDLRASVEKAEAEITPYEDDYIADQWPAYTQAIDDAKAVLEDDDATQNAVYAASDALAEAIGALRYRDPVTVNIYFKSSKSFGYIPNVSYDASAPYSMTWDRQIRMNDTRTSAYGWYKASFDTRLGATHVLTFDSARYFKDQIAILEVGDGSVTDFYYGVDNLNAPTACYNLTYDADRDLINSVIDACPSQRQGFAKGGKSGTQQTGAKAPEATGDIASGNKIYFDNRTTGWSSVYYSYEASANNGKTAASGSYVCKSNTDWKKMTQIGTTGIYQCTAGANVSTSPKYIAFMDNDRSVSSDIWNTNYCIHVSTSSYTTSNALYVPGTKSEPVTGRGSYAWTTNAKWAASSFTVTPANGTNGTVSPTGAQVLTIENPELTLTATPIAGYEVLTWNVGGTSVSSTGLNSLTYTFTTSVTVTPVYTAIVYANETPATLPTSSAANDGYVYIDIKQSSITTTSKSILRAWCWTDSGSMYVDLQYVGGGSGTEGSSNYSFFRYKYHGTKLTGVILFPGNQGTVPSTTWPGSGQITSNIEGWTTVAGGSYYWKDGTGSDNYQTWSSLTAPTLALSSNSITVGEGISLKASGVTGVLSNANVKYSFYAVKDGTTVQLGTAGTGTNLNWKPASAGTYSVYAVATDRYGYETKVSTAQTLTVIPDVSYVTVSVENDSADAGKGTFSINPTATNGGDDWDATVDYTITAIPSGDYEVKSWSVGGTTVVATTTNTLTRKFTSDTVVKPIYTRIPKTVTIANDSAKGSYSVSPSVTSGTKTWMPDVEYTITVTPVTGYEVLTWNVDGTTVSSTDTNALTSSFAADCTVTPVYTEVQVTVTVQNDDTKGSLDFSPSGEIGDNTWGALTEYTITATPEEGYEVLTWNVGGATVNSTSANTLAKTYTADVTVYPNYTLIPTAVVVANDFSKGSLAFSPSGEVGSNNWAPDVEYTITASPIAGYEVKSWSITGVGEVASTETNKLTRYYSEACTVTPIYTLITNTVTISNDDTKGSLNISNDGIVGDNTWDTLTSYSIIATPVYGYEVKTWLVNGASVNSTSANTLARKYSAATTVEPVYTTIKVTVTISNGTGGTLQISHGGIVGANTWDMVTDYTITAIPNASYEFAGWVIGGTNVGGTSVLTQKFTANTTIAPSFSKYDAMTPVSSLPTDTELKTSQVILDVGPNITGTNGLRAWIWGYDWAPGKSNLVQMNLFGMNDTNTYRLFTFDWSTLNLSTSRIKGVIMVQDGTGTLGESASFTGTKRSADLLSQDKGYANYYYASNTLNTTTNYDMKEFIYMNKPGVTASANPVAGNIVTLTSISPTKGTFADTVANSNNRLKFTYYVTDPDGNIFQIGDPVVSENNAVTSVKWRPSKMGVYQVVISVTDRYTFQRISGDPITVNVKGSATVTLENDTPTSGSVTFDDGTTEAKVITEQSDITFTATPAQGYEVEQWLVNGSLVDGGATFTLNGVRENITVKPIFVARMLNFTASAGPLKMGTVSKTSGSGVFNTTVITITATPGSSATFKDWTINDASKVSFVEGTSLSSQTIKFVLLADGAEFTANFNSVEVNAKHTQFTGTGHHNGIGTLTINGEATGAKHVDSFTEVELSATASDEQTFFYAWYINIGTAENPIYEEIGVTTDNVGKSGTAYLTFVITGPTEVFADFTTNNQIYIITYKYATKVDSKGVVTEYAQLVKQLPSLTAPTTQYITNRGTFAPYINSVMFDYNWSTEQGATLERNGLNITLTAGWKYTEYNIDVYKGATKYELPIFHYGDIVYLDPAWFDCAEEDFVQWQITDRDGSNVKVLSDHAKFAFRVTDSANLLLITNELEDDYIEIQTTITMDRPLYESLIVSGTTKISGNMLIKMIFGADDSRGEVTAVGVLRYRNDDGNISYSLEDLEAAAAGTVVTGITRSPAALSSFNSENRLIYVLSTNDTPANRLRVYDLCAYMICDGQIYISDIVKFDISGV